MKKSASPLHAFRFRVVCAAIAGAVSLASCGGVDSDAPPSQAGATPAPTPTQAAKRPNILYIMADDLGYSDIHAFGGEINTPNLDALVASGRILSNHHTGTVCAITRAMLVRAPITISSAKARWACRPTNGAGCPATRAT